MWPLWLMTGLSGIAGYVSGIFSSSSVTPPTTDNKASCVQAIIANGYSSDQAAQMCYSVKAPTNTDTIMMVAVVLGGLASIPIIIKLVQKKKPSPTYIVAPMPSSPIQVSPIKGWIH